MTTHQRGAAAEAAVLAGFTKAGLGVWTPWSQFGPRNLMVESPAGLTFRVQVKHERVRESRVIAECRGTDHGSDWAFEIRLRLEPARNGQRRRVNFASDFKLEDWAARFGAGEIRRAA